MNVEPEIASQAAALEELLIARAYLYELFHKCFGGDPNGTLVEALICGETSEVIAEFADDDATMRGFEKFLGKLADEAASDPAAFADRVKGEYTRLFIGPGTPEAVPWESPHLTNEASFCAENTVAVGRIIRAHGLVPTRAGHVADDHVSILMSFMAIRARRALSALRSGNAPELANLLRGQQTFVREHMNNWLPSCAKRVSSSKTALLYPQLLEAAAAFAGVDEILLGEAAFWAEGLGDNASTGIFGNEDSPADTALARLRSIRLNGLEENELTEADRA